MNLKPMLGACAMLAALSCGTASAAVVTLTFEGIGDVSPVGDFYNGGPGGNLGISFSDNALAIIDSDAGGSGNFGGEPSPDTVMLFISGTAATLNYAAGFTTGFSFFYSSVVAPRSISVYDGLDATGNLLATLALPLTPRGGAPDPNGDFSPFLPIGVAFSGVAKSIDFAGTQNLVAFDNITFGSATPSAIPLPGALPMLLSGLAAVGLIRRRARR